MLLTVAVLSSSLGMAGCRDAAEARERVHRAPPAEGLVTGFSEEGARHVRTVIGFQGPESVRYDAEQDVFFVSSIAGFGSNKDGIGYITRVLAADVSRPEMFVESGRRGAVLNAPKGLTIQGDTLWVTDIDVIRGFHRRTGDPVATIDMAPHGAVLLNDIATGPDGELRVTDTGIQMVYEGNIPVGGDRIFSIGKGHAVSVVARGPDLLLPNGVTWDSTGRRWAVVAFHRYAGDVSLMRPGNDSTRSVVRRGSGQLDGVEPLHDGALIFSSWADSSIHVLKEGRDVRVIRQLPEPADIGLDTRRGRVLIPLAVIGHVQVWDLGKWW